MKKLVALTAALLLICAPALAAVDLSGYSVTNAAVAARDFVDVTAPFTGTLAPFDLKPGDAVEQGQALFTMLADDVRAQEDGVVTALFVGPGDDASAAMRAWGALGAMEAQREQRLVCTTADAYDADKNKMLHVGETLYFKSSRNRNEQGSGRVLSVNGSAYTVEVMQGVFELGESFTLYRGDSYLNKDSVGKGKVVRRDPIPLAGEGVVADVFVREGQKVSAGDRLFSLIAADAERGAKPVVAAPAAGVVASVAAFSGRRVQKGEQLCRLYLTDDMEIVADVDEVDLDGLRPGDTVYVTLDTDADRVLAGTVRKISQLGVAKANAGYFTVYVSLAGEDARDLMLGQSADLYIAGK